jgi:hypothetical protein
LFASRVKEGCDEDPAFRGRLSADTARLEPFKGGKRGCLIIERVFDMVGFALPGRAEVPK